MNLCEKMNLVVLLLLIALCEWADAQRSDITIPRSLEDKINHCVTYTTCSECLQNAGCAWCSEKVSKRVMHSSKIIMLIAVAFNRMAEFFAQWKAHTSLQPRQLVQPREWAHFRGTLRTRVCKRLDYHYEN